MPKKFCSGFTLISRACDHPVLSLLLLRKRSCKCSQYNGFTLIELLVVISILAIIFIVGAAIFTNTQKGIRDGRRKADLEALRQSLEMYKLQTGHYPNYTSSTGRSGWADSDLNPTDYMLATPISSYFGYGTLPVDPINNATYRYSYYRYSPGSYGCDNSYFYVIGIRKFEVTAKVGGWKCSGRDWGAEFDFAYGNYE